MNIKSHLKSLINKVDNIIVLNDNDTKFIYIKISKTGGSYLHRGFFDIYYKNNKNYFNYKNNKKIFNNWLNNEKNFNNFFIFSFVRNTFTRVISAYYYTILNNKNLDATLKQFISDKKYSTDRKYHIFSQYKTLFMLDENEKPQLVVNKIYFYENLDKSILELCSRINIKTFHVDSKYINMNSSGITNHNKFYDDVELYNIVCNNFNDEIEYFNFKIEYDNNINEEVPETISYIFNF